MSEFPDVPVTDVADDAVFLDIREQDEWDRGHAPGAIHIPMGELPSRLDELDAYAAGAQTLVVTCRSGGRVSRVLPWLEANGFEVANLKDGMRGWQEANKPLVSADGSEPHVP